MGALLAVAASGSVLAQSAPTRMTALQALINRFIQDGAQIRQTHDGVIVTPAASINHPENDGRFAHTNYKYFFPLTGPRAPDVTVNAKAAPFPGYGFETPGSLACVYRTAMRVPGCNPNSVTTVATGGSGAIAIVEAFHAPNVRADLEVYARQFGLVPVTSDNFVIWYCSATVESCNQTTPPRYDRGWEGQISLATQMAKALAPQATLYLVEARSASVADLMVAVDKASQLVAAKGGGQVSLSWGTGEAPDQAAFDVNFTSTPKITYVAASGDDPTVSWPASSPSVISVGGASISRNPATFDLVGHAAWPESGTGPSAVYPRPAFQERIAGVVGKARATPDVVAVANPNTGVWIYISNQGGWNILGGTGAASPVFAALVNDLGYFPSSTTAALNEIYAPGASTQGFNDVVAGTCGPHAGYWAVAGWDWCSGLGTPNF